MTTSEARHAPGPWRAFGKTIRSVCHQRHYTVARVGNPLFTNEANEANASLIAAAPELLEALVEMETHFSGYEDDDGYTKGLFEKARAAIAKATTGSAA